MSEARSRHPTDLLIRALVARRRQATAAEVTRIVERMATAPLESRARRVPLPERGARYLGYILGARSDSLTYHLVKRVALEEQWADGTTAAQYLEDLRRAIRSPSAQLVVFARRGGCLAATITPLEDAVPVERWGPQVQPLIMTVFSADRGIIISGYGISSLAEAHLPEDAQWLA